MIDIHNHFLPAIDDGAGDLACALSMARMAVKEGITHIVCTPHLHPGRFDYSAGDVAEAGDRFCRALAEESIPLDVAIAAEVRHDIEITTQVQAGNIPFLGEWRGKPVLLLEFPHEEVPLGAERLTQWLLDQRIVPMIAHPERNRGFIRTPSRLKPFLSQGCLLQVTASSITGQFGQGAADLAMALLMAKQVAVLASDAHNTDIRPPALREGFEATARLAGEDYARKLVETNPWQIVESLFAP